MMRAICLLLLAAPTPTAKSLNDAGMEAHREKNYDTAVEKFAAAATADPTWAIPPYNQACAMALLRLADPCGAGGDEILTLLKTSIALDPKRKERLMKDRDLASMRRLLGFHKLAEQSDLTTILTSVVWYGPSLGGVFGNAGTLKFTAKGYTATIRSLGKGDLPQSKKRSGTWQLDGATLILDGTHKGTLTEDGTLKIEGLDSYRDEDPDACGA